MKGEKWGTAGIGALLAFLISLSGVGCMVTGFSLTLESFPAVVLVCGVSSVFCAAAFRRKWGGVLILCALALLAGYFWRRGGAEEQLFQLLYRVSYIYNRAYGWGVLKLVDTPWDAGVADIPMAILGMVLAMAVTWTVCRGKSSVFAVFLALLPLFSCLVVTDTVPSEGYLLILILACILLLLTGQVRRHNPAQGNRLTVFAALPTALALGILFLAVPQEGYVNQSKDLQDKILTWFEELPQSVESAAQEITVSVLTNEQSSVNLSGLGRRIESTATVMEVTADTGGTLYLRGQDYDVYDGSGWTASDHRAEEFASQGRDLGDVSIQTRATGELLYLPYYPKGGMTLIGGRMDNTWKYEEYVIRRTGLPDGWREAEAYVPEGDGSAALSPLIAAATGESTQDQLRYQTLPNATQARAEVLVAEILTDERTTVEMAETIGDYVRNSARYDLNPSRMPAGEGDFALWFLEDAEAGYCIHFATAATVLLRAAGIEARYVSGYMVKVNPGQTTAVTGENAHAWAEYYVPALDTWLVLEATPADTNAAQEPAPAAPEQSVPPTQTQPTESLPTLPSQPDTPAETTPPRQEPLDLRGLMQFLKVLLTGALTLALVTGQRSLRIRLRRQCQRRGTPNARALSRWQEAELLAKLLRQTPPEELERLAQKAKFSQHTLTAEELSRFEGYLRTARTQLRQKPWWQRLVHQYIFAAY